MLKPAWSLEMCKLPESFCLACGGRSRRSVSCVLFFVVLGPLRSNWVLHDQLIILMFTWHIIQSLSFNFQLFTQVSQNTWPKKTEKLDLLNYLINLLIFVWGFLQKKNTFSFGNYQNYRPPPCTQFGQLFYFCFCLKNKKALKKIWPGGHTVSLNVSNKLGNFQKKRCFFWDVFLDVHRKWDIFSKTKDKQPNSVFNTWHIWVDVVGVGSQWL